MLVKDPHLRKFLLLLLQQNPQKVFAEEAAASGDEVHETPLLSRHLIASVAGYRGLLSALAVK